MKENRYCIYSHVNKINGKIYIGQTGQNVNQRWRNGKGYMNNIYFYKAIEKYGWDNFEHNILIDGLTKQEADTKEIELISYYDSCNPQRGYNLTIGGSGTNGYHMSDEQKKNISERQIGRQLSEKWKKNISESLKGDKSCWYGKTFSEDHRKNLSNSHQGQKSAMGMLGKKHSNETKEMMSETRKGHFTSDETKKKIGEANSKPVRCIETDIISSGLPEAFLKTGLNAILYKYCFLIIPNRKKANIYRVISILYKSFCYSFCYLFVILLFFCYF